MTADKEVEPVLIAFVKHNKLQFCTETFKDILSKVGARPVSVVSFTHPNGPQKDQIINECLEFLKTLEVKKNVNKGLVWKSRSDSDVKGIYICPEPLIIRKSCQEVGVLLMEINGCFDSTSATREDLILFALNCILSSTLIYSIEKNFSVELQALLQLFARYSCGGLDLSDSLLNLVLIVNNWSEHRNPFGYHDSSTCPTKGSRIFAKGEKPPPMFNYRLERLDTIVNGDKLLEEDEALTSQAFVNSFQRISFCLMPGKESQKLSESYTPPKFDDLWYKITTRLFHPSTVAIKYLGRHKFNGHHLAKLFEQLSSTDSLMNETDDQTNSEEELMDRITNVKALSIGFNYFMLKMDKTIKKEVSLDEDVLDTFHKEEMKTAIKLFESMKGTTDPNDKTFQLFESEVENVWQMFEELNRIKALTLNSKSFESVEQMMEQIIKKWNGFKLAQNGLDIEISKLIGFNLEGLTKAVHSVIATN